MSAAGSPVSSTLCVQPEREKELIQQLTQAGDKTADLHDKLKQATDRERQLQEKQRQLQTELDDLQKGLKMTKYSKFCYYITFR